MQIAQMRWQLKECQTGLLCAFCIEIRCGFCALFKRAVVVNLLKEINGPGGLHIKNKMIISGQIKLASEVGLSESECSQGNERQYKAYVYCLSCSTAQGPICLKGKIPGLVKEHY